MFRHHQADAVEWKPVVSNSEDLTQGIFSAVRDLERQRMGRETNSDQPDIAATGGTREPDGFAKAGA